MDAASFFETLQATCHTNMNVIVSKEKAIVISTAAIASVLAYACVLLGLY
jgi:hypothetical protein